MFLLDFLAWWMARPMYQAWDIVLGIAYRLITSPVNGVGETATLRPKSMHWDRSIDSTLRWDSACCTGQIGSVMEERHTITAAAFPFPSATTQGTTG